MIDSDQDWDVQRARNAFVEDEDEDNFNNQRQHSQDQDDKYRFLKRKIIKNISLSQAWKRYLFYKDGPYLKYIQQFQANHLSGHYLDHDKKIGYNQLFSRDNLHVIKIENGTRQIQVIFPHKVHPVQKIFMDRVTSSIDNKYNGLLESPTGTGKTLSMLLPILSYQYYLRTNKMPYNKICFFSRTHSQLSQIYDQLNLKSCYRPTTSRIGSRNQFCKNQQFKCKAKIQRKDINNLCRKSVNHFYNHQTKKRPCQYYLDRISEVQGQNIQGFHKLRPLKDIEDDDIVCPVYQNNYRQQFTDLFLMPYNYLLNADLLPIYGPYIKDSIVVFDEAHNVLDSACSGRQFSFSLATLAKAEKQVKDNILFVAKKVEKIDEQCKLMIAKIRDNDKLSALEKQKQVDKVRSEAIQFQKIIDRFKKIQQHVQQINHNFEILIQEINIKRLELITVENNWNDKDKKKKKQKFESQKYYVQKQEQETWYVKAFIYPNIITALYVIFLGAREQNIKQFMTTNLLNQQPNRSIADKLTVKIHKIVTLMLKLRDQCADRGIKFGTKSFTFLKFLQRIDYIIGLDHFKFQEYDQNLPDQKRKFIEENELYHYQLLFKAKAQKCQFIPVKESSIIKIGYKTSDENLQFKMFVPWFTFKEIQNYGPRSILFTSGTMSPMSDWQSELKIPLLSVPLSNDSMINDDQICTHVLSYGYQQKLNFLSKNLNPQRPNLVGEKLQIKILDLALTIFEIIKHVPHGVLVFFPNKKLLKLYKEILEGNPEINNKIGQRKYQIFEDKEFKFQKHLKKYQELCYKGAILYCVLRGKISQGIDLPNHQCRAVIVVGVPFPNIHEPYLGEKKKHYQKLAPITASWDNIYNNSMIRAVNQAVGRVIRNPQDYGQIFFLDERYNSTDKKLINGLSKWIPRDPNQFKKWSDKLENNAYQQNFKDIQKFYADLKQRLPTDRDRLQEQRNNTI